MLLAELRLRPSSDPAPYWLQPYLMPRRHFDQRWAPDDSFRSARPGWLRPEDMYDGERLVPPEKWDPWVPSLPVLDYSSDPLRRRLEEHDREYPRRPLRRN